MKYINHIQVFVIEYALQYTAYAQFIYIGYKEQRFSRIGLKYKEKQNNLPFGNSSQSDVR